MIRVEPKLLGILRESASVQDTINTDKRQIDQLMDELATTTHQLEVNEAELREKELLWTTLKRCRLCAGNGHGKGHGKGDRTKGSTAPGKHGGHGGGDGGEDFEEGGDGTFASGKSHQRGKGIAYPNLGPVLEIRLIYFIIMEIHIEMRQCRVFRNLQ